MKNLLYILLFVPFALFGQEEDPCYSVNDFMSQTEGENSSITKNFVAGWNMFGYPCSQPIDLVEAFSSIVDKVLIVKSNNGSVYMPEWGFNGIGFLEGGEGYQIKMANTEYGFSFCETINWPNLEGCTDCQAFNFNKLATINNNSCTYDTDGDGVIDANEISGCQDNNSCNYNALATEEGVCTYPQQGYDCNGDYLIYTLGEYKYGGVVFWVDESGQKALVASLEDLPENYSISYGCNWDYCEAWALYEGLAGDCAEATCIGCGLQNTLDIALLNDSVCEYETTASQVVNLEYNGYSDWFLPSKDELQEMLYSIGMGTVNIGGLSGGYWASTNGNVYNFGLGYISNTNDLFNYNSQQPWTNKYRPIRAVGNWIEGCTNPYACNFNSEVNLVNNSLCEFSSFYGDDTYMYDCEGTPICYDENACNYYTVDYSLFSNQYSNFSACDYPELGYDCDGNITAEIGDIMEGGYLFYIDETGGAGLVAALEDLGQLEWGCHGTDINGNNSSVSPELDGIGTGLQNTLEIVSGCSETPIAASEALAYESGGYSDWFLPSKDELVEMFNTIGNGGPEGNIGGFFNYIYGSSSEHSGNTARGVTFGGGDTVNLNKNSANRVRVIRAFGYTQGCMDSLACNYTPSALVDDESCEYPPLGYDCEGNITEYLIGMEAEGGIVFYVDGTGEHGLVAALEDLGQFEWGCYQENVGGADGTSIGTGYQNTMDIVNYGCATENGGITAAQAALDAEINGYSDWYLPSKDELYEMYNTIGNGGPEGNIGDFVDDGWPYWSSSEYSYYLAWLVFFYDGATYSSYKFSSRLVRIIRAF